MTLYLYLVAGAVIVVLMAILGVIVANRRAKAAAQEAEFQARRAADAEAVGAQRERTVAEILGVEKRHKAEEEVSDEKLEKGDRDHLAGDW